MSIFGALFSGNSSSDQEKTTYFEKYKKYNNKDIKKISKRFDKYDKKKFQSTMAKHELPVGKFIRGQEILDSIYEDHGFRFKREVKDTLTDKIDNAAAERLKSRNLALHRFEELRAADREAAHSSDYHHVETDRTHDHAKTSFFQPGSSEPNKTDINHDTPTHSPGIFNKGL
ncbi:MAG TPA: hypothetical protein PLJ58_02100 [bacterium]|nr:hypothetical protein [bacterium]